MSDHSDLVKATREFTGKIKNWNFRIVKYADGSGYGLHEVYYDKNGNAVSMTEEPASFVGDTPAEIHSELKNALDDAIKRDIFEEPEEWRETH